MACVFCRDKQFQDWAIREAAERSHLAFGGKLPGKGESMAKAFILHVCAVSSRNDLDVDAAAAQRFHELVRKPFLEWKEGQS
jgi:hypothetical protein